MGVIIAGWQESLLNSLTLKGFDAELVTAGGALYIKFRNAEHLVLHLIPVEHHFEAKDLLDLQFSYRSEGKLMVQLWEDVWLTRPVQVLSRIYSMLGRNKTVHGRKTKVRAVTQPEADAFFNRYHLQGSASARYKYALTLENEIVAMASFSAKRNMTRRAEEGYTSVELIRFASTDGITVQGGLSKLIGHLVKTIHPNDIMTYTDLDWSYGNGYAKLGFELVATTAPAEIWLNKENMMRYFPHRLPDAVQNGLADLREREGETYLKSINYSRVFNTGSLKYILHL